VGGDDDRQGQRGEGDQGDDQGGLPGLVAGPDTGLLDGLQGQLPKPAAVAGGQAQGRVNRVVIASSGLVPRPDPKQGITRGLIGRDVPPQGVRRGPLLRPGELAFQLTERFFKAAALLLQLLTCLTNVALQSHQQGIVLEFQGASQGAGEGSRLAALPQGPVDHGLKAGKGQGAPDAADDGRRSQQAAGQDEARSQAASVHGILHLVGRGKRNGHKKAQKDTKR
jgi:hypothetical protein